MLNNYTLNWAVGKTKPEKESRDTGSQKNRDYAAKMKKS